MRKKNQPHPHQCYALYLLYLNVYDDCLVLFLVVYVSSFAITFDYSIAIGKSYHFPALFLFIAVLSVSRLMIFTKDGERFRSSSVYIPFALLSLWFCMSV